MENSDEAMTCGTFLTQDLGSKCVSARKNLVTLRPGNTLKVS